MLQPPVAEPFCGELLALFTALAFAILFSELLQLEVPRSWLRDGLTRDGHSQPTMALRMACLLSAFGCHDRTAALAPRGEARSSAKT